MDNKKSIADSLFMVEFAEQTQPDFLAQKNKDWVLYGVKNDYTKYLIDLYNRNAEHNAIISAKASYISGKGLTYDKTKVEDIKQQAKLDKFIGRANRFQSWDDLIPLMTLDLELFNGYALQVIYGAGGKIADVYHLEFSKLRLSKDGKKVYFCNNWYSRNPEKDSSFSYYPIYDEDIKSGTSIFYFKIHRPSAVEYGSTYPIPDYVGACSAIETDINIDVFHLSNTQNGMNAQGLLTFFNGDPTNEDKRKIKEMFESNYTGPNKAGKTIFNFVSENQKGAEFTNLSVSDLDKQFEILGKRLQQKIITGHKVTNPILFGIKTEGQLGNRTELIESFEHFTKTYIDLRRPLILGAIQMFGEKAEVMADELYIIPLEPIGLELPLSEAEVSNSLTFDEKRTLIAKKYNIELTAEDSDKDKRLTLANKLGVGGVQSLMEVIKDTSIAAERKVMILNGLFGISIKKAQMMIGFTPATMQPTVQAQSMSEDKDLILEALLSRMKPANDDEVIDVRFVHSSDEAKKFEAEIVNGHKFADVVTGDVRTVRDSILSLLAGNPSTKVEEIAKVLGLDSEYVQEQIDYMIEKSVISESVSGFTPTGKGLDKVEGLEPVETQVYTAFRYALSPKADYQNSKGYIDTSHEFCKEMMKAANRGETLEAADIDDLTNEFGTDVWTYKGGLTGHKGGETTKYCNHIWQMVTKVRKKGAKK